VRSTDQGTTWTPADRGFPAWADTQLLFDPKNSGTIYAPYIQLNWSGAPPVFGLLKSTDGGRIWTSINPAIPDSYISSFAIDGDSILYAGYHNGYRGSSMFKSTDGGASWQPANAQPAIVGVPSLSIDPAKPDTIYALAGLAGVFMSADRGANWTTLSALPIPTDPSGPIPGSARSLAIHTGNSNILYAWAPCHLFESIDAGMTWLSMRLRCNGTGDGGFLTMDPHDANTLCLAESDVAEPAAWLLKTADGSMSWRDLWQSGNFPLAMAIDPAAAT